MSGRGRPSTSALPTTSAVHIGTASPSSLPPPPTSAPAAGPTSQTTVSQDLSALAAPQTPREGSAQPLAGTMGGSPDVVGAVEPPVVSRSVLGLADRTAHEVQDIVADLASTMGATVSRVDQMESTIQSLEADRSSSRVMLFQQTTQLKTTFVTELQELRSEVDRLRTAHATELQDLRSIVDKLQEQLVILSTQSKFEALPRGPHNPRMPPLGDNPGGAASPALGAEPHGNFGYMPQAHGPRPEAMGGDSPFGGVLPRVVAVRDRPLFFSLKPCSTLLNPFVDVVDYRMYRLRNIRQDPSDQESLHIGNTKKQVDALAPTLRAYDGTSPMKLLELLSTLRRVFDTLRTSEGVAALLLPYYLAGGAKEAYDSLASATSVAAQPLNTTWPYLCHGLLKRYCTDSVLRVAYDKVASAAQQPSETEDQYADRLQGYARECANVFSDQELVNNFIKGLLASTRDAVSEHMLRLPEAERSDIAIARRVATSEGNTFRARQPTVSKTPKTPKSSVNLTPSLEYGAPYEGGAVPFAPFPGHIDFDGRPYGPTDSSAAETGSAWDSWNPTVAPLPPTPDFDTVVNDMSTVLLAPVMEEADAAGAPLSEEDLVHKIREYTTPDKDVLVDTMAPPSLTADEVRKAFQVIPSDYYSRGCWTCREGGHTSFTCPLLTARQRIYFAFRYYLYQCAENPHMAKWLYDTWADSTSGRRGRGGGRAGRGGYRGRGGYGRGGYRPYGPRPYGPSPWGPKLGQVPPGDGGAQPGPGARQILKKGGEEATASQAALYQAGAVAVNEPGYMAALRNHPDARRVGFADPPESEAPPQEEVPGAQAKNA